MLDHGGMGTVFRGFHLLIERDLAIKLLKPELALDDVVVSRFLNEARTISKLRHPNIVEVLDMGTTEDGVPFLVLELLEGELLANVMGRDKRVPFPVVVEILAPIMEALGAAHAIDIVHRDVKPENIFLHRVGDRVTPKLLDFGIAKGLVGTRGRMTSTGTVMGTPHYMAPEQANGTAVSAVSDVWSIGVVMYEALSGRLPFDSDNYALLLAQLVTQPTPPLLSVAPDVHPDVAALVDWTLSKDAKARPQSMQELRDALLAVAEKVRRAPAPRESGARARFSSDTMTPVAWVQPPRRAPRQWKTLAAGAVGACLLLVLTLLVAHRDPPSDTVRSFAREDAGSTRVAQPTTPAPIVAVSTSPSPRVDAPDAGVSPTQQTIGRRTTKRHRTRPNSSSEGLMRNF